MSKPRRPRYQRSASKPASAPASAPDQIAAVPEPVADSTVPPELMERQEADGSSEVAFEAIESAADLAPTKIENVPEAASLALTPVLAAAELMTASAPSPAVRRLGTEAIGTTVMNYVIGEGEAFAAHMRALAGARTMAEFVRLQIGEFQRAADATLSCWGMLAMSASRTVSPR